MTVGTLSLLILEVLITNNMNKNKKITYKKIDKDTFERIIEETEVDGALKLSDIVKTRDYYQQKFQEMDELVKQLKKVK